MIDQENELKGKITDIALMRELTKTVESIINSKEGHFDSHIASLKEQGFNDLQLLREDYEVKEFEPANEDKEA